jgi:hypothetical protein
MVAWRQVDGGDVRDIYLATSPDKGQSWSQPIRVGRDNWVIKGCPHVGPAIATLEDRVYLAWFSEGADKPSIYLASSNDGGSTFLAKKMVSEGTTDPTHPQLVGGDGKLALVFQARDATANAGWGKMAVYYREIYADGSVSSLVTAAAAKAGVNYPTVALGMSGRIFVGWTESQEGNTQAYLIRGRSNATSISQK